MWFWLSLIALLCWSGSDLFSKIGCRDARDKYSHLKMVMAVGVVMGLHAAYEVFVGGTVINLDILLTYLPVSLLYILSMAMGYVGLRYIELSISSPICNSSGALVAVLAILFDGIAGYSPLALFAVALVCVGAVGLGVVEVREDDELRIERQKASNYKYTKSFMALAMPAAYCVLDAAGTFADSRVLEIISRTVEFVPLLVPYVVDGKKRKGFYFDFGRVYWNKPEGYTYKRDRTWQFNNLKPRTYK